MDNFRRGHKTIIRYFSDSSYYVITGSAVEP